MIYKTQAIILRRRNLGETDKILTVFTKQYGKKNMLAKGVRKPLSKLAGSLELFCLTQLNVAEGRNLDIISGSQIQHSFLGIRGNLKKTNLAYCLAEITDKLMPENEVHPEIFDLLSQALNRINEISEKLLLSYFEINFLGETGFKPELFYCLVCHEKIKPGKNFFDFEHGGLVCGNCSKGGRQLSDEAIKILRLFLSDNIEVVERLKIEKKLINEINRLSGDYLTFILQKDLNSKRFVLEAE